MRRALGRIAALALLAVAPLAPADIVLNGFFHVGDEDNRLEFTPLDPVRCTKYRSFPSTFHLSEAATITAFTLHDAVDLDDTDITLDIDGTLRSALVCGSCPIGGTITVDLTTGISLSAGDHTVAVVDPDSSGACTTANDMGWSALTLVSTATTTSVMFTQRRHVGDDDDDDDDYDFTSISSSNQYYPDTFEGNFIDHSFTLASTRRLSQVRINRLRDVNSTDGMVQVNGSQVGTLTTNGEPYIINTSLLLLAGTHTLRVTSGTLSGQRDDQSWDGIVLRFADTGVSGTPGFFNAVDVGGNALTGSITTKIAGGGFTLDLYALTAFGTGQDTSYAGFTAVELLDATNNSGTLDVYGCNSTWAVAQTLSASTTFAAGKAQVTGTFIDAGLKEARIRVTDLTTGARGCSLDNFAIRPANLGIAPSQGSETTPGVATALTNTATSGMPRHRAGRPFTIVATGRTAGGNAVTNYTGSPTVASATAKIAPASVTGALSLGNWGAASGGARRTDEATYAEAGAVTIALEDASWADVDADDTSAAQRSITGSFATGRFVPDHFRVTDGSLATACAAGGFSYLGSALAWVTPAVTLTAENGLAAPTTTLNYEGALETLPATLAQPTYATLAGTPALNTAGLADPVISAADDGVATITLPSLSFPRTLVGAFDAEISITLPVFDDDDDILPSESPVVIGTAAAGGGVAFTAGKSQRFGRLYLEPRYGSERLPMNVPLRAEYFDGVSFTPNTADTCTVLTTGNVTLVPLGGQTHVVNAGGNGRWTVQLSAPNVTGQAGLSIDLAAPGATVPYPLLMADTDNDGSFDDDPAATVSFGLYTQDDRRIYQREVVGN